MCQQWLSNLLLPPAVMHSALRLGLFVGVAALGQFSAPGWADAAASILVGQGRVAKVGPGYILGLVKVGPLESGLCWTGTQLST